MIKRNTALSAAVAAALASCGGGSDSGFDGPGKDQPPTDIQLGGIWDGTLTDGNSATDQNVIILTTEPIIGDTGEMRVFTLQYSVQASGGASTDVLGLELSGDVTRFTSQDFSIGDDIVTSNCAVDGTFDKRTEEGKFDEKSALQGSFVCDDGDDADQEPDIIVFETLFNPLYDRNTAIEDFSGIWNSQVPGQGVTLTFNPDGTFNGDLLDSTGSACTWTGSISDIEGSSDRNLYNMSVELSSENCGPSLGGAYGGLIYIDEKPQERDSIFFQIDSGSVIFSIEAFRNQ
ncbi:MAG: hypothetical protein P8Y61_05175 [Gammaproteobacteria bacterium]|jgi:hypothetical protein